VEKSLEGGDELQLEREKLFLQHFACEQTQGSRKRLQELSLQYRQKTEELEVPRRAAKAEAEKAAAEVRATTQPTIAWGVSWIRATLQAAPASESFSDLCLKAIREIESMQLQPLADVLKTIEKYADAIQTWDFGEKPAQMLPALSIQTLVA